MPYHNGAVQNNVVCHKCQNAITEIQNYVECDKCRNNYHLKCGGVIGQNITRTSNENQWVCKECKSSDSAKNSSEISGKRKDRSPSGNSNKKPHVNQSPDKPCTAAQFETLMKYIAESKSEISAIKSIVSEIKTNQENIQVSHNELQATVNEVKANQEFLSNKFDDMDADIQSISNDNKKLKNDVDYIKDGQLFQSKIISNLEIELDSIKQLDIANNIVISGLPLGITNTNELIQNIMKTLQTQCTLDDVVSTKLILPKEAKNNQIQLDNNSKYSHMIVNFKTLDAKSEFLLKKKEKRSLLSKEVGLNLAPDHQLYIREQLTPFKMLLFKRAREIKLKFKFEFLWIKGTKICLRKHENSQVLIIKSQHDLNKIESQYSAQSNTNNSSNNNRDIPS